MSNHERTPMQPENSKNTIELESIGNERREVLRTSLENAEHEHKRESKEALQDVAKNDALKLAENTPRTPKNPEQAPATKRGGLITRRHRDQSFKKQMDSIQPHLSRNERAFSKVIHNKAIETASDTLGSTVARPNALLAGSVAAFIIVTAVYLVAKNYGYQLSGFETIAAFVIGWILGLIFDYARLLIRGKSK